MSKFNKFFDLQDKSYKDLRVISLKSEQKMPSVYASSSSIGISLRTGNSKGGEVCKGQTIITKSNYEIAGKKNKDGKRNTQKEVGSHAAASLDYMDNHGAKDIENDKDLSNIYDEAGERLTKDELSDLKNTMKDQGISSMRRTMIDIGQKGDITREEYINLVKDIQNEFMEQTGKNFDYKIAIHTDHVETGGNIHAHILSYGNGRDTGMNKDQLKLFKQISRVKTEKLLESKDRSLKKELNKVIDKAQDISKTIDKLFENSKGGGLSLWKI